MHVDDDGALLVFSAVPFLQFAKFCIVQFLYNFFQHFFVHNFQFVTNCDAAERYQFFISIDFCKLKLFYLYYVLFKVVWCSVCKKNVALWKNPTNIKWNNVDGKQTPSYEDQQLQAPRARSWDNFIFYVVPRVVLIFGFIFVYVLAH